MKEAKRVFKITKSAIPHRINADTSPMALNRWYT